MTLRAKIKTITKHRHAGTFLAGIYLAALAEAKDMDSGYKHTGMTKSYWFVFITPLAPFTTIVFIFFCKLTTANLFSQRLQIIKQYLTVVFSHEDIAVITVDQDKFFWLISRFEQCLGMIHLNHFI